MRILVVVLALVLAGCADLVPFPAPAPPAPAADASGTLRVHYVDVGQGDGVVWELPDGSVVVYDCGPPVPTADENPVVLRLRALGLASGAPIRALIASHGHLDHVGGCDEVFAEYRVEAVYDLDYRREDRPHSYRRFQERVEAEGASLHAPPELRPGTILFVAGGARAVLLWPESTPRTWDDIAEGSLVVRIAFGGTSFCFQGDIEARAEASLSGRCDVYLVGHHGSREASSARWLAQMRPSIAVVSFGENSYGHPTSEALCRTQLAGAVVYATHRAGTVVVESKGFRAEVVEGAPETIDYCGPGASYWP